MGDSSQSTVKIDSKVTGKVTSKEKLNIETNSNVGDTVEDEIEVKPRVCLRVESPVEYLPERIVEPPVQYLPELRVEPPVQYLPELRVEPEVLQAEYRVLPPAEFRLETFVAPRICERRMVTETAIFDNVGAYQTDHSKLSENSGVPKNEDKEIPRDEDTALQTGLGTVVKKAAGNDLHTKLIRNVALPISDDLIQELLLQGHEPSNQTDDVSTTPEAIYIDIRSKKMYFVGEPSTPATIFFNIQIPVNNFVGRISELRSLKEHMQTSPTAKKSNIIAVSGLGGIGKTQLVRQFIDKNRSLYKNFIWINAENCESINESFKTLAEDILVIPLNNSDGTEKDLKSIIEQVLEQLSKAKTLFVYDNVNNIESIKFILTKSQIGEKSQVIITSRIKEWGGGIEVIPLKVWEFDDAIKFVATALDDRNESIDEIELLVERMQGFPLALTQATAYINHQRRDEEDGFSVEQYDLYEMLRSKLFQEVACNLYDKTTFTTWDYTIDEIKRNELGGLLAVKMLCFIAYFDAENIHSDIFVHLKLERQQSIITEENIRSAVRLLINYSMIDRQATPGVLSLHRLVQKVMQLKLKEIHQEKIILRDALMLMSKLMEIDHIKLPETHSHAVSVFLNALKFNDLMEQFKLLPDQIISSLIKSRKHEQAVAFKNDILSKGIQLSHSEVI